MYLFQAGDWQNLVIRVDSPPPGNPGVELTIMLPGEKWHHVVLTAQQVQNFIEALRQETKSGERW
jgi:hypothetical protein